MTSAHRSCGALSRAFAFAAIVLAAPAAMVAQSAPTPPRARAPATMLAPLAQLSWEPRTPVPGQAQIAIVHVDPITHATQLYFKCPPKMFAARHWHSANETNVVVRGSFVIQHDGGEKMTMGVGDMNWMPGRMIHQAWSGDEETIIFVSLDGPWDYHAATDSLPPAPTPRH